MKITVWNIKGSIGKTPIATNITLDKEYAIATNFSYLSQLRYLSFLA